MSRPVLRQYQIDLANRVEDGGGSVVAVAPTGAGKTMIIGEIVSRAVERGERVLIVAHRQELLDQIGDALDLFSLANSTIAHADPRNPPEILLASVGKMARRGLAWRDVFDLVLLDEAHHAVAGSWGSILALQRRASVIGLTATPERLDGRGLGDVFARMEIGPEVRALIDAGHLCEFVIYAPAETPDLTGARRRGGDYVAGDLRERGALIAPASVAAEYERLASGLPALCFAADLDHSRAIVAALCAIGFPSAHVDGETSAVERAAALAGLAKGEIKVISNVGLFAEGLNIPNIAALLMARPTASLGLYRQMIGRALRPAPGKDRAIILDLVANCGRHGMPDAPHEWSLDPRPARQRERREAEGLRVRRCPTCSTVHAPALVACPACGGSLRTAAERHQIEVRLEQEADRERCRVAIEKLRTRSYEWRVRWAGADERRLRLLAEGFGYARGWIFHRRQAALQQIGGRENA